MGNKLIKSNMEGKLPFRSEALLRPIFQRWDEYELAQSNLEFKGDIAGDKILDKNLRKEFKKVKKFLEENNLGEYFVFFEKSRVIFRDLEDFIPNEDNKHEIEEMLKELIPDIVPRGRFKKVLLQQFQKKSKKSKNRGPTESNNIRVLDAVPTEVEETQVVQRQYKNDDFNLEEEYKGSGWHLDPNLIFIGEMIGQGAYGCIKRGILKIGLFKVSIAIKEIFLDEESSRFNIRTSASLCSSDGEKEGEEQILGEEVIEEIEIMTEMNHRNICKCFGCYFRYNKVSNTNMCYCVLELCSKGDLFQFLHKKRMNVSETELYRKNELFILREDLGFNIGRLNELLLFFFEDPFDKETNKTNINNNFLLEQEVHDVDDEEEGESDDDEDEGELDDVKITLNVRKLIRYILYKFEILVNFLMQVSDGMSYMNELRISHFDLKSKNVLLKGKFPSYRLKICDFGTSVQYDFFSDTKFTGTVEYMAPQFKRNKSGEEDVTEQDFEENYINSFDIFSFGVLAFEILNLIVPYQKERENSNSDFDLFFKIHNKLFTPYNQQDFNEDEKYKGVSLYWMDPYFYFKNRKKLSKEDRKRIDKFNKTVAGTKRDLNDLIKNCLEKEWSSRPDNFKVIHLEISEILFNFKIDYEEELGNTGVGAVYMKDNSKEGEGAVM